MFYYNSCVICGEEITKGKMTRRRKRCRTCIDENNTVKGKEQQGGMTEKYSGLSSIGE